MPHHQRLVTLYHPWYASQNTLGDARMFHFDCFSILTEIQPKECLLFRMYGQDHAHLTSTGRVIASNTCIWNIPHVLWVMLQL